MEETLTPRAGRVVRAVLFLTGIGFVAALLAAWAMVPGIRESKSLWVLFLYSFPSEFVIATVPHEPAFLYFSKFHPPWIVAGVSVIGTVLTEWLNYRAVAYVIDWQLFRRALQNRTVKKCVAWFARAPFAALWVAGFTPIPFYPFRVLAVVAKYPVARYLAAVFLSRAPRFWILCVAGAALGFADWMIGGLALVLAAAGVAPAARALWRKRKRGD